MSNTIQALTLLLGLYCIGIKGDWCPSECVCRNVTKTLNCFDSGLKAIPTNIPPNMEVLYFTDNNLTVIHQADFANFKNATKLRLDNNSISLMHPNSVMHMHQLESLYINKNKLTTFDIIIANLTKLTILRIESNNLMTIREDAFVGLTNLTILALQNNELSDLPESLWQDLTNLEVLRLEYNKLTYIRGLNDLVKLRILFLSNNFIKEVYATDLPNPSNMQVLRLENNHISLLDSQQNSTMLRKMFLAGNYLSCSCDLYEFVSWMNVTKTDVVGAMCNGTEEQVEPKAFEYCKYNNNRNDPNSEMDTESPGTNTIIMVVSIIISTIVVLVCLLMCFRVKNNDDSNSMTRSSIYRSSVKT